MSGDRDPLVRFVERALDFGGAPVPWTATEPFQFVVDAFSSRHDVCAREVSSLVEEF